MIFASVPVIQPPDQLEDTRHHWEGVGSELLIVDNTPDGAWRDLASEFGWSYQAFGKNAGVNGSWNIARAWFFGQTEPHSYLDHLFLFSASVEWIDGLAVVMHDLYEAANWKGCQTAWGFHGIAWSRAVFDIVGTFDENYYPGYLGDCDWARRCILEGILSGGDDAMPQIETNGPKPRDGRAITDTGMISNTAACNAYFQHKHGGPSSAETYSTPFDSGLPTSWWSPSVRPGLEGVSPGVTQYR